MVKQFLFQVFEFLPSSMVVMTLILYSLNSSHKIQDETSIPFSECHQRFQVLDPHG